MCTIASLPSDTTTMAFCGRLRSRLAIALALLGTTLCVDLALAASFAGDNDPQSAGRKALSPRPVAFSKRTLPLHEALAELAKFTGNTVGDQRRARTRPETMVPDGPTNFWPALDAIGKASGIGFSAHLADGGIAFVDTPYRPVPTAYGGIFRIALRRLAVAREEETPTRHCQLALDIAWEPRFQPFYLDLKDLKITFAPDAKKKVVEDRVLGRGPAHVAGRGAVELDVLTAAPDRTSPKIDALQGTVWAVGPSAMLTFSFDKLTLLKPGQKPAPRVETQDGVTVKLASIRRNGDALLVKVQIENPKGSPGFESHQSWLDNNRIVFAHKDRKRTLTSTGSRDDVRGLRADVEYEFAESASQPLPASLDGWTLRYETPGAIVELTAPFAFKDIALP
jgi:hypothetical protein